MKILYVITSLLPGGAERLSADLLLHLQAMGHDVEIAVFNAEETYIMRDLQEHGIKVHKFYPDGGSVYSLGNWLKLRRLLKANHYDIVHAHNTSPQVFTAMCAKGKHTKFVTTEHNTSNRRRGSFSLRLLDKWMYSRYDKVISISDLTQTNLLQHLRQKESDKYQVIRNGIDIPRYHREIRQPSANTMINVTMVAGFRKQKDHDTLIRALSHLPRRYHVTLAGDGERRAHLERLASEVGVRERVDFLGARSDIPAVLEASDITVLISHYEGLSLASIEAMASGRPLIASDVEGLRDVVGGYGVLVPEGDDRALAAAIMELGDNPDIYTSVAEACQARAQEYDIDITAKNYLKTYVSKVL